MLLRLIATLLLALAAWPAPAQAACGEPKPDELPAITFAIGDRWFSVPTAYFRMSRPACGERSDSLLVLAMNPHFSPPTREERASFPFIAGNKVQILVRETPQGGYRDLINIFTSHFVTTRVEDEADGGLAHLRYSTIGLDWDVFYEEEDGEVTALLRCTAPPRGYNHLCQNYFFLDGMQVQAAFDRDLLGSWREIRQGTEMSLTSGQIASIEAAYQAALTLPSFSAIAAGRGQSQL